MAKSIGSVLLKSMRRIANKQQAQANRAVKSLFALPKPARKKKAASGKRAGASTTTLGWAPLLAAAQAAKVSAPIRAKAPARSATKPGASVKPRVTQRATVDLRAQPAPYARPERGSFTRGVFEVPGNSNGALHDLHYWLYWPSNTPATPRALVVMLHGCGQTATEFAQGTRMNELAQRKGFAVLYPQQSVSAEASRCWPWYTETNQRGGGDAATIQGLIESVLQAHPVDRRRVYLAGMSAGAAMAQIIALNNPGMIAAVGMHSGPVFGTADSAAGAFAVMQHGAATGLERALRPIARAAAGPIEMPGILIHGSADKVVRPVNLMQVAKQFILVNALEGGPAHPHLRDYPPRVRGAHPRHGHRTLSYLVEGKPRLVVCQITGLEHAWSGGVGGLRFNSATGPDASLMLWNFFARHRRSNARQVPAPAFAAEFG